MHVYIGDFGHEFRKKQVQIGTRVPEMGMGSGGGSFIGSQVVTIWEKSRESWVAATGGTGWIAGEKQLQILRLTTPNLHPKEQKRSLGTPENVWGPVRSG
jgi:hypothetical protein